MMEVKIYFVESAYPLKLRCKEIDHMVNGMVRFKTKERVEFFPVHRIASIVVEGDKYMEFMSCPFCNGTEIKIKPYGNGYAAECSCGARGKWCRIKFGDRYATKKLARKYWNQRG